jgi:beta-lactam-binding protein with PASTA domain
MGFFNRIKFDIDLDAIEGYVANNLRLFISLTIGLIVFVGIIAISVFFIAVRGTEQTMVPDVRGRDLTEALLELQTKELYPRLQLRYSQSVHDKGQVLEQEPAGGAIVKAGRRIRLVVSQGVVLDRVGNYVGRNINEVRVDLQTLFASMDQPLLSLQEPFMYENSSAEAGTILQQKPEPETGISGPTVLQFVISRGPEKDMVRVPNLAGLSVAGALEQINQSQIDFVFSLRPAREGEQAETVIAQEPAGGTLVTAETRVSVVVAAPARLAEGEAYGLFRYVLSPNVYPLRVTLEALLPSGERRDLASADFAGGEFTMPYRLPVGSVLIFSMLDRELYREEVREPVNTLSWDQL